MLQSLRQRYGHEIKPWPSLVDPSISGANTLMLSDDVELAGIVRSREWFTFPSISSLAHASEGELRSLGMGYRADFVKQSASMLSKYDQNWLKSLRGRHPNEIRQELMALRGVGAKV